MSEVEQLGRIEQCHTCQAAPDSGGPVVMWIDAEGVMVRQPHTDDCAAHQQWQKRLEVSAARFRQEDEWATAEFPAAYARLQAALEALTPEERANPFTAALAELAGIQAEREAGEGGFVPNGCGSCGGTSRPRRSRHGISPQR